MNTKVAVAFLLLNLGMRNHVVAQKAMGTTENPATITIQVLGAVNHPGKFTLSPNATILDALTSAGGQTDFAVLSQVQVHHQSLPNQPVIINVSSILKGTSKNYLLCDGDTIRFKQEVY